MSYKTVLVHADGGGSVESRIRLAARLAQRERACLIGAGVRLPTPLLELHARGVALLSVGVGDSSPAAAAGMFRDAENVFFKAVAGFGLEAEWRSAIDVPAIGLANMMAAADLLVVGPSGPPPHEVDTGDLVMKAGRPILVVPNGCDDLNNGHALIAWKNTREARRALVDALPLLKRAGIVTLLHVSEPDSRDPSLVDPRTLLVHHGIEARAETSSLKNQTTAEQILGFAVERSVDLIVLGAFGHSRAREWAFGGVTRDLLDACPVPCLFSR